MLINGASIRKTDKYRHKYDSGMTELLDTVGFPDDEVGSVNEFGNYRRWGKRIVKSDDLGFAEMMKFPSARDAERYMSELRSVEAIIDVANSTDSEIDHVIYDAALVRLEYVLNCALGGLIPHHSLRWSAVSRPLTPVGDERPRRS